MVYTVQCSSLFSVFEETGLALVEYKICFPLQKYFVNKSREIMVSHADVLIRRYETKDYGFVCKLFYECLIENWIPAYR